MAPFWGDGEADEKATIQRPTMPITIVFVTAIFDNKILSVLSFCSGLNVIRLKIPSFYMPHCESEPVWEFFGGILRVFLRGFCASYQ